MRTSITYKEILASLNKWATNELVRKNIKFSLKCDQFVQYLNYSNKLVYPSPRKISFSEQFKVSPENQQGFLQLEMSLKRGEDINCYLSKLTGNAEHIDYLLDGYGIKHFHLGINKKDDFIERTGELALGFVTAKEVFFITTKPHGDDTWYGKDVLEIIHKERPDLIEHARLKNICDIEPKIKSVEDIKLCRKNHLSIAIELDDGAIYFQYDLGTTLAGYSSYHVFNQQNIVRAIMNHINQNIINNFEFIINEISLNIINIIPNLEVLGELTIHYVMGNKLIEKRIPLHLEKRQQ